MMGSKSGKTLPRHGVERIMVRGTNWIGDAVLTLPAISSIRETYPLSRISILAKPWVADIYRLSQHIDEVIPYESPGVHQGIGGMLSLAKELKARNYDMAILLQNAMEAAIIARLAAIPIRAGYDSDARGFLLTHAIRRTKEIRQVHQVDYYLAMVKALGCKEPEAGPLLHVTPEDDRAAGSLLVKYGLRKDHCIVGMAPGATYGPAKKWFPERFAALADRFQADFSARTILFGSRADREATEAVNEHAKFSHLDLTGKTDLRTAVSLIAGCRLFISNDSGLMHVAGALNIPTIAIFGSTNPVTTAPVGEKSMIIYKDVECSPCLKKTCTADFRCIDRIETGEVYELAKKVLWEN